MSVESMYLKDRLAAGEALIGAGIYRGSPDILGN